MKCPVCDVEVTPVCCPECLRTAQQRAAWLVAKWNDEGTLKTFPEPSEAEVQKWRVKLRNTKKQRKLRPNPFPPVEQTLAELAATCETHMSAVRHESPAGADGSEPFDISNYSPETQAAIRLLEKMRAETNG